MRRWQATLWCMVAAVFALTAFAVAGATAAIASSSDLVEPQPLFINAGYAEAADAACIQAVLAKPLRVVRADVINAGRHPYEHSPRTPGRVQTATIKLTYPLIDEDCTEAVERIVHIRIEKQIGPDRRWHRLRPGYNWTETVAVNNPYPVALAVEFPVNESYEDWYYWHPGEEFRTLVEVDAVNRSSRAVLGTRDEYVSMRLLSHK